MVNVSVRLFHGALLRCPSKVISSGRRARVPAYNTYAQTNSPAVNTQRRFRPHFSIEHRGTIFTYTVRGQQTKLSKTPVTHANDHCVVLK